GRRGHPPLRAALEPDRGPQEPHRAAGPAAPQHHPARVLLGLRRRDGAHLRPGPGRAARPGRTRGPGPGGQRVQPRGAGGGGLRAHGRAAHLPRLRALPRAPEPGPGPHAGRRPHERTLRGPCRTQQAARGPHPAGGVLEEVHLPRPAPAAGGQAPEAAALLRRAAGPDVRGGFHPRGGGVHRARGPPRPARLLLLRARLRVHERARGVRRSPGGGDADGRPGPRAPGRRRARHARPRGRPVRREEGGRGRGDGAPAGHGLRLAIRGAGRTGAAAFRLRPRRGGGRAQGVRGLAVNVAFVVQRYGPDITGGSETLARAVAERLAAQMRITVLTTCARDYVTWRNELPAGPSQLNGVEVVRFPVEEERDLEAFNRLSDPL